jgi:hypothetical protein
VTETAPLGEWLLGGKTRPHLGDRYLVSVAAMALAIALARSR